VPAGGTTYNTKFAVNILGSNGYRLQFANVDLPINGTSGNSIFLRPTTAPVTITGTVKQVNGNTAGKAFPLELAGTATDNLISGAIKDPDDYPANTNARALSIIKSDTSTWTLSGINTFSGTTTVSAGTLVINGGSKSQCLPDNNLLTINAGKVHLPAGVNEKVGSLKLGAGATITGPTTYGSSASGAAVKNDTYFAVAGTGILYVGMDIPKPGTLISFF
jgi:autotransporter-associated beta strand protein